MTSTFQGPILRFISVTHFLFPVYHSDDNDNEEWINAINIAAALYSQPAYEAASNLESSFKKPLHSYFRTTNNRQEQIQKYFNKVCLILNYLLKFNFKLFVIYQCAWLDDRSVCRHVSYWQIVFTFICQN